MNKVIFLLMVGALWLFVPYTISVAVLPPLTPGIEEGKNFLAVLLAGIWSQVLLQFFASLIPAGLLMTSGYERISLKDIAIVVGPVFVISLYKFIFSDLLMDLSPQLVLLSVSTRLIQVVVPFAAIAIFIWMYRAVFHAGRK